LFLVPKKSVLKQPTIIPWRAISDEHILDWFYDSVDTKGDSALTIMLQTAQVDTANMRWVYTSNIPNVLTEKGQDFYSQKIYSINTLSKDSFKIYFRIDHGI
jgi:hypothetical protein